MNVYGGKHDLSNCQTGNMRGGHPPACDIGGQTLHRSQTKKGDRGSRIAPPARRAAGRQLAMGASTLLMMRFTRSSFTGTAMRRCAGA